MRCCLIAAAIDQKKGVKHGSLTQKTKRADHGDYRRFVRDWFGYSAHGGQAIAVRADVGDAEDVRLLAQAAQEQFGGFDTWVNNAGVSIYGKPVLRYTLY